MGKCDWEGHKQKMTEANRAKGAENVRRKDRRSIIRQAVLALLLCGVAVLVACTALALFGSGRIQAVSGKTGSEIQ